MKTIKEFLSEVSTTPDEVKGWNVTNVDPKRGLVTYVKKNGKVSITFGKDGWVAANPKKKFDTIDDHQGSYDIIDVLGKFK